MTESASNLQIGRLLDVPDVPLHLKGPGLAAHTLIVGQSGSGKSFMLGRLMEEIAAKTQARIVILDPNSDFVRFSEVQAAAWTKFAPSFEANDTEQNFRKAWAQVSFSLLTSRDPADLKLANKPAIEAATLSWEPADPFEAAAELGLDIRSDVDEIFALNNVLYGQDERKRESFAAFVERALKEWRSTPSPNQRPISTVYARATEMRNLNVWATGDDDAGSVHTSVEWLGKDSAAGRVLCVDLASMEKQDARLIVANAVLKDIWNAGRKAWLAAIAEDDLTKDKRCPVFIVIDEAHNLAPTQPASTLARAVLETLARIATEGRKYGIFLLMVTQRPSRLDETLRTQCDNLCLLKMNNRHDLQLVESSFGFIPDGWAKRAVDFKQGDVLFAGGLTDRPVYAHSAPRRTAEGGRNIQDPAWLPYVRPKTVSPPTGAPPATPQ